MSCCVLVEAVLHEASQGTDKGLYRDSKYKLKLALPRVELTLWCLDVLI